MAAGNPRVMTVVLGGGRGSRLYPLTAVRAKPAVPLAGRYRLIDIPISNAINAGLRQIFVLTQFNSASLNQHINRTYRFDPFSEGFVEVLAAEQTEQSGDWYQGTADAVRKHLHRLVRERVSHVLVLSGDHLYRMDYAALIAHHEAMGADVTLANIPVPRSQCGAFGILAADEQGWITGFREKPSDDEDISHLAVPGPLRRRLGMPEGAEYLASMGVYVFRARVLREMLEQDPGMDFGHHLIPNAIGKRRLAAYLFDGYWEDIGTVGAFYRANLALCSDDPPFRLYVPNAPIYTRPRFLPPSIHRDTRIERSIVAEGCVLLGATIRGSVVGLRTWAQEGCEIVDSIVMGADYYESEKTRAERRARGEAVLGIGAGVSIRRAIVDKGARIGDGAVLHGSPDRPDEEGDGWAVRDGIVIVKKNAVIPPGTRV